MENCSGCAFYRVLPETGGVNGECRRHAPRAAAVEWTAGEVEKPFRFAAFPIVVSTDWCGDFAARSHALLDVDGEEVAA